jgi:hypothetical protein
MSFPPDGTLTQIRTAVGGTNPLTRGEPTEHFYSEEFDLDGLRTEVSFVTVSRVEQRLDELLDRVEEFDSPMQKILSGVLESLPLDGEELVEELARACARLSRATPANDHRTPMELLSALVLRRRDG